MKDLTPQQEQSIKAAVKLIGAQDPETVVRFVFSLGYMEGALAMAKVNDQRSEP